MSSTAEEILAFEDRKPIPVKVWNKDLFLKPMSGIDRGSYDLERNRAREAGKDISNWRAEVVVRCLVDAEGNRVFTNEQAAALGQKNADLIRDLHDKATDASLIGTDAVGEAAKNS